MTWCRVQSDDYEKLVDREVRAALQRMKEAEDIKDQGLRTWRLPESLKVQSTFHAGMLLRR